MLFCTVVSHAFDQAPPVGATSNEPPVRRSATETLALYVRALDDMRVAYAQVSADYAGALQTACALRETLLRAELRIRRGAHADACRASASRIDALEARVAAQATTLRRLQRVASGTRRFASRRASRDQTTCVARS